MPGIPKTTGTTAGSPQWARAAAALVNLAPDRELKELEKRQEEMFETPQDAQQGILAALGEMKELEKRQEEIFETPDDAQRWILAALGEMNLIQACQSSSS